VCGSYGETKTFRFGNALDPLINMDTAIRVHDVVALLEEIPAVHFETGRALRLRRGQMGTMVMAHDRTAFDVEFAGRDGRPYALLPIPGSKLMILRDTPDDAAA